MVVEKHHFPYSIGDVVILKYNSVLVTKYDPRDQTIKAIPVKVKTRRTNTISGINSEKRNKRSSITFPAPAEPIKINLKYEWHLNSKDLSYALSHPVNVNAPRINKKNKDIITFSMDFNNTGIYFVRSMNDSSPYKTEIAKKKPILTKGRYSDYVEDRVYLGTEFAYKVINISPVSNKVMVCDNSGFTFVMPGDIFKKYIDNKNIK